MYLPTIGTQIRDAQIDLLCRSYSSVRTSDAASQLGMDEAGTVACLCLFFVISCRAYTQVHTDCKKLGWTFDPAKNLLLPKKLDSGHIRHAGTFVCIEIQILAMTILQGPVHVFLGRSEAALTAEPIRDIPGAKEHHHQDRVPIEGSSKGERNSESVQKRTTLVLFFVCFCGKHDSMTSCVCACLRMFQDQVCVSLTVELSTY